MTPSIHRRATARARGPGRHLLLICVLLSAAVACKKAPVPATAPPLPQPAPAAAAVGPAPDNAVSQASEFVARGKPDPNCHDCKSADASSGAALYGKPGMKLDEKTVADAKLTVEQTCSLLERGVEILEANVKQPERAGKALKDYQEVSKQEIERIFHRADEIRARLRAAGYEQDIPAEIRPLFEERMGAIQKRLETMRDVYRNHQAVLEAFGALFPRAKR